MKQARPQPGALRPYESSAEVTPMDGDLPYPQAMSAILVGGEGVIRGRLFADGAPRDFPVQPGVHLLSFREILPGTTATGLVALF